MKKAFPVAVIVNFMLLLLISMLEMELRPFLDGVGELLGVSGGEVFGWSLLILSLLSAVFFVTCLWLLFVRRWRSAAMWGAFACSGFVSLMLVLVAIFVPAEIY